MGSPSSTKEQHGERQRRESELREWLLEAAAQERERQGLRRAHVVSLAATRDRVFLEDFKAVANKYLGKRIPPSGYALRRPTKAKKGADSRVLNLMLSDLHFGAALDPSEVGKRYDYEEEARRLAWVVRETSKFKVDHREQTELHVHLLGDIIQGNLHDPRDGQPLATQVADAMHLLHQAIAFLAQNFPSVKVFCTPGNHGRNAARYTDRQVKDKVSDSHETDIYIGVAIACKQYRNVNFHIPRTPYYVQEVFGQRGFFTHGDTVLKPGYPGKSIAVESVRGQINEINSKLEVDRRYKLFAVGHVHVGSLVRLPGNWTFMSNGCLIPPDAFANSIGIFDCTCGQWLWESVPEHIVGDSRFLVIPDAADTDASLEAIIRPFNWGEWL